MGRRGRQKTKLLDRYRAGVRLYCNGDYLRAIGLLGSLAGDKGMAGRLAGFYQGRCHRELGLKAMAAGQFGEAEKHLRAAMGCMGRQSDLTAYLCSLYVRTKRYDHSLDEMANAVRDQGDDAGPWRGLAQAQWRSGRREDAFMTLTKALRRHGTDGGLMMQLGLFHAAENRMEEARTNLAAAARADSTNAACHHYHGLAEASLGNGRAAVRAFQRAWALRPEDVMLAMQLAMAARSAGSEGRPAVVKLPQAGGQAPSESHVGQLAACVQEGPDFVDAFLSLPPAAEDRELFETLENVLRQALANHSDYPDLQLRLSRVLSRLERRDEAIESAARAVEINPAYVRALTELSSLYDQAGREEEAIATLEQAIECGADWPDIHYRLGELLMRCQMGDRAGGHFTRALELEANFTRAADALARMAA